MAGPQKKTLAQAKQERKRFWQKITRDIVLFSVGLVLFMFEALIREGDPRETIVLVEVGMMGLPAILRADELRRRNGNGSGGR